MHPRRHSTCCNGHDLTAPGALYVRSDGYTECRACKRDGVARFRNERAMAELRTLRERAMETAPHLVAEITARIAQLQNGGPPRSDRDIERDLDVMVAAESLPSYLRERPAAT